jgi:hypothetical protein
MNYQNLGPYLTYNETTSAYTYKFPDTIENKPVVGLNGCIFGYPYYTCQYSGSDIGVVHGSFDRIDLPSNLEILGSSCFYDIYSSSDDGTQITLPYSLKALLGSTRRDAWTSSNSFCDCTLDLSPNMIDGKLVLPDLDYCAPGTLYNLLYNSTTSLAENTKYIESVSNPYAYYYNTSGDTEVNIEEGCNYVIDIPSSVSTITFPSTLKALPSLHNLSSLTNITFTSLAVITEIPSSFCYQISNLTSINIPEGITTINQEAFSYCSKLADITLPSTITYIGSNSFSEGYGVSNLNKVIKIKAKEPPRLYNSSVLAYSNSNISKIIVPQGCLDKYKKASNWSTHASKMEESAEW